MRVSRRSNVFGKEWVSGAFSADDDKPDEGLGVREGKCNVTSERVQAPAGGDERSLRRITSGFLADEDALLALKEND